MFKILSWNINSIRQRLDHLAKIVSDTNPDILCLQETKVMDSSFPQLELRALGFPHMAIKGMKSYNGVATLSKTPLTDTDTYSWCGRDDCRHQSVTLDCGIELHNLYVPAGGDIPDPLTNPKFAHKLNFLSEQADWWRATSAQSPTIKRMIVGDFNIAPLESDVWSHKALRNTITHTPIEIDRLDALRKAGNWIDAMGLMVPPIEKPFTWWSYRNRNWPSTDPSKDRGRRLDHVWVSPGLVTDIREVAILSHVRGWNRPSDHAPLLTTLALERFRPASD